MVPLGGMPGSFLPFFTSLAASKIACIPPPHPHPHPHRHPLSFHSPPLPNPDIFILESLTVTLPSKPRHNPRPNPSPSFQKSHSLLSPQALFFLSSRAGLRGHSSTKSSRSFGRTDGTLEANDRTKQSGMDPSTNVRRTRLDGIRKWLALWNA